MGRHDPLTSKNRTMKNLNETELLTLTGGVPSETTSMAYDISYGVVGIVGTIWSAITSFSFEVPERGWHSGTLGGG
jgi:hypothetical protein